MKKTKRDLKVYETSGYRYKTTPTIMLKGEWLKEWGFQCGDKVVVECSQGELKVKISDQNKDIHKCYRL